LAITRERTDPGAIRLRRDVEKMKGRLETGKPDCDEVLDLVQALERRLEYVEEDNRSYEAFFDNLIQVLGENLEREEIRRLIHEMGLRDLMLQNRHPATDSLH
jgi:hypothetical protein